ncbi:mediator of RNA polymerase II transcription subunit 15 isoform X1 [Drosophila santomea]|uniref:mediator of RNA polymerase II transcription subunit 15 isoform X1 n=1 Tax=Drosophila santomea TaxID=129105 RepID=UPI001953965C|nr:mediator of RNA polymerase II transcription subunit 15 isoform X1 [Drosophila santomea]XP_039493552.1 mediator of RNA polymerase II transcription subunit 15 isoform X1 [Drosophila santomea]
MWIPMGRLSDWLLPLAFVVILVSPSQATGTASQPAPINRSPRGSHNSSGIGDSELSASERSRRLIPYMAFYLPAPELPINQQYATKHSSSAGGAQLQAPLPGPGRIPVPVAYMPQQKHHPHHHGPPHPPPVPHYQSGAGEVYHSLAIGSHQHQHAPPHPSPGHVKEQQAITNSGASYIAYKPLNPTHKHKTVQHFPPLPPSPKEQVQQPQQQQHQHHILLHHQQQQLPQQFEILSPSLGDPQSQRQRGKQSKINLTPFTAQNTLPGQFIPIIYTPVNSKPGSSADAINYNNIQSNLKQPEIVYKNSHQTQIVTDYAAGDAASAEQPSSSSSVEEERGGKVVEQEDHGAQEEAVEEQPPQQHQQVPNNPSIGYASVSVPDSSAVTATTSSKNALIIHQKSPHFGHSSKYESYFNMAPPPTSVAHHPHQQHPHMTPQEKYVLYLQQRMKHQKHQQHLHLQQQQQQQQQQQHYDFSHPVVPAQSNTLAGSHQPPPQHSHLHPHHPQTKTHHPNKYDALYVRPDATAGQQVLHIPLRALMAHVQEQSHSQSQLQAESQAQSPRHDYVKDEPLGSPAPPQFIDYLIDGPRQSLEEEQQHSQHERPSPHQPPQHAYILVTTTAPHIEHQPAPQMHPEISTPRPPILYNQQPTLRLQPVHTYKATRRPIYVTTPSPAVSPTSSHTVEITPKYVYVSGKPPSAHNPELPLREPSTVTPIKLKPVYKYAHERPPLTPAYVSEDQDQLPDIRTSSLAEILHKLQASNHLPQTLTPDNIDNSIKTLIRILQNLKQTQTIEANPPQHHEEHKSSSQDYDYNTGSEEEHHSQSEKAVARPKGPNKHPGPSTGRPGIDYPNYAEIPQTSFECTKQRYKGFFGDPETNCQVWHYCDLNGGKASFLCPNGTIFSQIALTCDWWFNVKCSTTAQLYVLNERLYKYILPFNPKFPEDYNGPIVDKYLAMKFQEMEEKMRKEKQRKATQQAQKPEEAPSTLPALPKNHKPEPKHGSGINAQVYEQSSEKNLLIDDEIDDISERGTYDTFDQTAPTTIMAPTSTQDTQSFVLKPIVVSSTPQPLPEIDFEVEPTAPGSSEEEDHLQRLRETKEVEKKTRESTRVSVEKLEVIEIKTDGNTGQLMPIKSSSK